MAVNGGPKIPTDGLILNLDFANFKSNRGRRGLINWNEWTSGSGGTTSYVKNGLESENRRIWDTNPFGNTDIVWDSPTNDVTGDGDGGWNYNYIPIDPTKMYRHTVWIRRPTIGNGSSYLGTYGFRDTTNVGVLYRTSGTSTTNPYFRSSGWWGSANTWYLMVGHTWPFDSGTGSIHENTGVWALDGTRTTTCTDFIWKTADTNKTSHRSYLFYSTNTSTNQQWYQPRIDLCDGTEPTLQELLNDAGNKITDISYNGNDGLITGSVSVNSDNLGSYDFDGVGGQIEIADEAARFNNSTFTLSMWFYWDNTSKFATILAKRDPASPYTQYSMAIKDNAYTSTSGKNLIAFTRPDSQVGTDVQLSYSMPSTTGFYNAALVVSSNSQKLYLNSANVASSTADYSSSTFNISGHKLTIGSTLDNSGNILDSFDDKIASVMIFNRSLSEEEIKTLYNSQRGRFGL